MTIPYSQLRLLSQDSPIVELFIVDATMKGGAVYRFSNFENSDGQALVLSGISYLPLPIVMTGFGINTTGAPIKPTLIVSNVSKELHSVVVSMGDMVGATVERIRMFAKHLDDGSAPDSSAIIGREKYVVDQKTSHDFRAITFSLSTPYDRPGVRLPLRQALRDPTSNSTGFPALARRRVQ